jgi:hypothetical protein
VTHLTEAQTTVGSTAGSSHRTGAYLRNNQDGASQVTTAHLRIGTVSDGCGSQPHSEYGSRFTVNILPKLILGAYSPGMTLDQEWFDALYQKLVKRLRMKAKTDFLDPIGALNTHLMATAGGVIETPELVHFYGAGDFVIVCDGEVINWRPEDGNKPLYPAYSIATPDDPRLGFRVHTVPVQDVRNYLFGSDGVEKLVEVCGSRFECIPGTDTPVGPISQIWATDKFYLGDQHPKHATTGPEEVDMWLNRLAQNWRLTGPAQHGGLLDDDTTFYARRRVEETTAR